MFFVFIFSSLFFSLSSQVQAQESLNGYLKKTRDNAYLLVNKNNLVKIKNVTPEVLAQLSKLKTGDLISGIGSIEDSGKTVELTTIDFVGLQRLLGVWQTNDGNYVNFISFSEVIFGANLLSILDRKFSNFTYSLSPYNDSLWILYLTNNEGTLVCTLYVDSFKATISVIDTISNSTMTTIELTKVYTTRNNR